MKKILVIICYTLFIAGCSRKTILPKPNVVLENNNNNHVDTANKKPADISTDSSTAAATSPALVMIIADGYGRLITPQQNLPADSSVQYNSLQLSKDFTVQQRANLQARYNTVPPRVLYVPQQYALSSLKGVYYIYRKKFWYWKKQDGLFYLDQKYYL